MQNNKLFKLFIGFAIGPIGAAFINLITIPITTWFLAPEEFGKVSIMLVILSFGTSFLFMGFDHAFVRDYNEGYDKAKLLLSSMIIPIVLSFSFSIICLILKKELSVIFFDTTNSVVIILLAIWAPFVVVERFFLLLLRMEEKAVIYSFFNILIKFIIMILTIVFLLLHANYLSVIAATIIGEILVVISIIYYIIFVKKTEIFVGFLPTKVILKLLKYGLPFVPTGLLIWFLNSTDRIFLNYFSDFEEIGIYFTALKIVGLFTVLQLIFTNFWLPVAFKWEKEEKSLESFEEINNILLKILFLVFLLVLLFKDFLKIVLPIEYHESLMAIPFLMLFPITYTLAEATGIGIAFSRKTILNLYISLSSLVINIFLNLILIPWNSIIGASMALGFTYVIYFWMKTITSNVVWKKMSLKPYILYTILMVLISIFNVFITQELGKIIDLIVLIIFVTINRKYLYFFRKLNILETMKNR